MEYSNSEFSSKNFRTQVRYFSEREPSAKDYIEVLNSTGCRRVTIEAVHMPTDGQLEEWDSRGRLINSRMNNLLEDLKSLGIEVSINHIHGLNLESRFNYSPDTLVVVAGCVWIPSRDGGADGCVEIRANYLRNFAQVPRVVVDIALTSRT